MRVYARAFDWDEAKRMRDAGMTVRALAEHFGVSEAGIRRVTTPGLREKINAYSSRWQSEHKPHHAPCPDCGGIASAGRYRLGARCRPCAALAASSTVRPDALLCTHCGEWKPDDAFPAANSKVARRGRHAHCRPCQTQTRRAYRAANPGVDAATQRASRRRRRQALASSSEPATSAT